MDFVADGITVCNRTGVKCTRVKIEGIDFNGPVSGLKTKTARSLDLSIHEFELIYAGKQLKNDESLQHYGVKPGVTVHALKKSSHVDEEEQLPGRMEAQQVVTALQSALMNPAYRSIVERMVSNPDMLDNLVAATPGLDKDPVARAMLQDPDLLAILADPTNIRKVIESHPCLSQAAMLVAAAVNEEGAKVAGGARSRSARGTYSLDQMSDDEDDPRPRASSSRQASQQPITALQLAAALSAATGSTPPRPAESGRGGSQPPHITTDLLQQAMEGVATGGGGGGASQRQASQQQAPPPAVTEAGLQQLRDMGITDEVVARQALQASGGDIQAALEIIFGESIFPQ